LEIGEKISVSTMSSQPGLTLLYTAAEIAAAVDKIAAEITRDYRNRSPVLVGILKGSFVFLSDLARRLDFPLEIEFVRLSTYGSGRETSGEIKLASAIGSELAGRHVLVVEDIVDTGLTTDFVLGYLAREKPASLRLCALADKPSRRRVDISIDYRGLTVPDRFIVGYGLDCAEQYRHLPDLCTLEESR
jgi:hypoxanthine phosphoribosyltransferase